MKSLVPWVCLVAAASHSYLYAAEGLDAYRQGKYFVAAKTLIKNTDPVANYYLGRMRLYGFGELKNNPMALRYFTQSAEKGYLPAQQLLARYYLIEEKDPAKAINWFKKAAAADDTSAQMFCAAAYLFGYGVTKNTDTARRYYIDAAKNGNPIAQYTLGMKFLESRDKQSKKLGVIWLNKAADQNNAAAQTKLGQLYSTGTVVEVDAEKAKGYLDKAIDQNYFPAKIALGELYLKQKNYDEAKKWLTIAADTNDSEAQLSLAQFYLLKDNPLANMQQGFELVQKSAQQNNDEAQKLLASLYKEGKGTPANEALAKEWLEKAKKKKESSVSPAVAVASWLSNDKVKEIAQAGYQLGGIFNAWQNPSALRQNNYNQPPQMEQITRKELYKPQFVMVQPQEVPINDYFDMMAPLLTGNQADDWSFPHYPIDAQIDNLLRHESKVLRHEQGVSVIDDSANYLETTENNPLDYLGQLTPDWQYKVNFQTVLSNLYGQAILGESNAQYGIGQLYQYGIGVAKNAEQARIYYELAAIQQDVRAEYNLGVLYLEGHIKPLDYEKGIEWMTDAAFKGNSYAQYVLANIYEKGLKNENGDVVIKPNHEQALAMYYLASVNHYGPAEYRLADYLTRENKNNMSVAAKQNRFNLIKRLYEGAAKQGIAEAALPVAFYHAMSSDPAKQAQAFTYAKKEAIAGHPDAALLLGIMYERGIGTPANSVEALYWYQQASLNPVTEFILGTYYSEGKGLSKDINKGMQFLQQAADAGFSYANLNLAVLKHNAGEEFLADLDKARVQGNSRAGLLLADYYLLQANNPENMAQARDIYQHFADRGDKDGQLKLAFLYERGLAGEVNNELAEHWYTLSAQQGQPIAQYLLAHMYQMGRIGKQPNYIEAKKWYSQAQSNYPKASLALGFIYDTVDDDYLNAANNYDLAAKANDVIGKFNLGLIYEYGKGMPVDKNKAKALYDEAAQQGYSHAMAQLAGIYFHEANLPQALYWYKKAAALGENSAQYQLGLLSETGVGTKIDYAEAVNYYQQASNQGNDKAKLALARMYQYGLGIQKDERHAADLYRELADNNNAFAQYQLAVIYAEGVLGESLIEQAKVLLKKASENGNTQADKLLQRLTAQKQEKLSFIEPIEVQKKLDNFAQSAELMYMDALSEWNRGDAATSRLILDHLISKYPQYTPAKRAYEQLSQPINITLG